MNFTNYSKVIKNVRGVYKNKLFEGQNVTKRFLKITFFNLNYFFYYSLESIALPKVKSYLMPLLGSNYSDPAYD